MTNGKKQIAIEHLEPGMYVVGMDQSWLRTPFFSHRRLLKDAGDVDTLRRCGVRWVTIDTERGRDVAARNGQAHAEAPVAKAPRLAETASDAPPHAAPRPKASTPIFDHV